jgi:hypothetical protein
MGMDIAYCVRDTYAPARFGELPLLSVPCKTDCLTRSACLPQEMGLEGLASVRYIYIYILTFDLASALTKQPSKLNQTGPETNDQLNITGPLPRWSKTALDPYIHSATPGLDHGGNSCSTSPGRYHGGNLGPTSSADAYATQVTPAQLRPADAWAGSICSTSPGLATVVTPCTSGVLRLAMALLWRRFPLAAGRYCPSGGVKWSMRIDGNSFGMSQPCIVRRIATVHRSAHRNRASFLLGRGKGQPSATMVGIDGGLGKSSPLQVHRSFAMLVSRLINHPGDRLADSRWSLARCDAGYSTRFAVFGGRWSVRFGRFNAATLGRRFGDAKTSSERKAPGESR